jgi:hypothetical protein
VVIQYMVVLVVAASAPVAQAAPRPGAATAGLVTQLVLVWPVRHLAAVAVVLIVPLLVLAPRVSAKSLAFDRWNL